jgi:hypothetical protein
VKKRAARRSINEPPFRRLRELMRRVKSDCSIDVNGSVPWRLIGESVEVVISHGCVRIEHAATNWRFTPNSVGRQCVVDPAHFYGIAVTAPAETALPAPPLRPLSDYEQPRGEGWQ